MAGRGFWNGCVVVAVEEVPENRGKMVHFGKGGRGDCGRKGLLERVRGGGCGRSAGKSGGKRCTLVGAERRMRARGNSGVGVYLEREGEVSGIRGTRWGYGLTVSLILYSLRMGLLREMSSPRKPVRNIITPMRMAARAR